jgi:phosphatidylglycerol:prolipoprotein diacylglycerol transferase
VSGLFLLGYGVVRFAVEFVRQPDAQFAGQQASIDLLDWMTRGQWLCVPMILVGLWFMRKTVQRVFLGLSRD